MFQTEPILWLQAHSSTALTWLLSAITLLGYAPGYVAAVLALAFGFRLRPGLGVLVTLLVCGLLTEGLKDGLALPRPYAVDARVLALAVVPGAAPRVSAVSGATHGGAASFWGFPAPEAIVAVRSLPQPSYGFPSGHASAALAFVLATGLFFGFRRVATVGLLWPFVMSLSRMYLGRHFLADVLGGLAVGGVAVVATALLLRGRGGSPGRGESPAQLLPLASVCVLLGCLLPFVSLLDPEYLGRLAGASAAYAALLTRGFPSDAGTLAQRSARVVAPAVVLLLASRAAAALLVAGGWEAGRLAVALAHACVVLLTLVVGVAIERRLGWYAAR
jgi:membrane-associated phospholipid phosphatase